MDWSAVQSIQTLEVSRRFRFRVEERELLLRYCGIRPDSHVAEIGCGTGILARHLAEAMPAGSMLAIDATPPFVQYAHDRRGDLPNITYVVGDAYSLPVSARSLDACTSYTLLAVLHDPMAALKEQMRVARVGGVISAIEVIRASFGHPGEPPSGFSEDERARLGSLRERWSHLTSDSVDPLERKALGYGWEGRVERLPLLLEQAGLHDVQLRGFTSPFSTSDTSYPTDARRRFLIDVAEHELSVVEGGWRSWRAIYREHGFSDLEKDELLALVRIERDARLRDFDAGRRTWTWHASLNIIVAGTNPD